MIFFVASACIGGLGIACILKRATLLGVILGVQLLALSASLAFVVAGVQVGSPLSGGVFGLFVSFVGVFCLES